MSTKSHTAAPHEVDEHHGRFHLPRINWRHLLIAALAIGAVVALFLFTELEWRQVPAMLEKVSRPWALLIMATAPLVGFPISAVYLAAGALFGPWLGLAAVAGVTASHLVLTQVLARTVLRDTFERWRKKWSRKIPEVPPKEHASLVAMVVLVPGVPYVARNWLLGFSNMPWRLLLGVGLPLYVFRSSATIFLGDLGNDPSWQALAVLGTIYFAKIAASFYLFQRLRHSLQKKKSRTKKAV